MATEIERKFLVVDDRWRGESRRRQRLVQGYLANTDRGSIRVRLEGDRASLNIKSMTLDVTRSEFDYPIPVDEAEIILHSLCMKPLIEKTRHYLVHEGHTWEVDEFHGDNAGLVVAEIELRDKSEPFAKPSWLGKEVSDDPRYYNVCLVERPFRSW